MPNPHTFTVIIDTYYRPALLKEAVEAVQRQTYENLEIILVNNGATAETVEYLHEVEKADCRVTLVHFRENQFSWDDPLKAVDVCLNAALKVASGDYVWYQSDDDLIADDYAEKMVALFKGNPECTTAAGVPISIDIHGNVIDKLPRTSNYRPRYMPGHLLALDVARGGRTKFSAPGSIFTIKRDVLVNAGGYHRAIELSQLNGIVPFGITGFDETALFYWRRHEGQLNRQLVARGWTGSKNTFAMLKEWEIEGRWQVFSPDMAKEVVAAVEQQVYAVGARLFIIHLTAWRCGASLRVIRRMWNRPRFWLKVPPYAIKRLLLMGPLRRWLKPRVRRAFVLWPDLAALSPRLASLRERVNR